MKIEKQCPNCKSKNLSDGKGDFIYSITEQREIPIQFCNDCHAEWIIENENIEQLKQEEIKWIKEDMEDCNSNDWMLNRWKKRLNITEENLNQVGLKE